jgi:hypothetical protein
MQTDRLGVEPHDRAKLSNSPDRASDRNREQNEFHPSNCYRTSRIARFQQSSDTQSIHTDKKLHYVSSPLRLNNSTIDMAKPTRQGNHENLRLRTRWFSLLRSKERRDGESWNSPFARRGCDHLWLDKRAHKIWPVANNSRSVITRCENSFVYILESHWLGAIFDRNAKAFVRNGNRTHGNRQFGFLKFRNPRARNAAIRCVHTIALFCGMATGTRVLNWIPRETFTHPQSIHHLIAYHNFMTEWVFFHVIR